MTASRRVVGVAVQIDPGPKDVACGGPGHARENGNDDEHARPVDESDDSDTSLSVVMTKCMPRGMSDLLAAGLGLPGLTQIRAAPG